MLTRRARRNLVTLSKVGTHLIECNPGHMYFFGFQKSPIIYAAYFGNMCALRRLIKDGADVTVVASGGYNCLDVAIMSGKKEICMEIIKHDK